MSRGEGRRERKLTTILNTARGFRSTRAQHAILDGHRAGELSVRCRAVRATDSQPPSVPGVRARSEIAVPQEPADFRYLGKLTRVDRQVGIRLPDA